MNKEELIKEYDEKEKALRDEFISKLEGDKKEFKLTYPEENQTVYHINGIYLKVWDFQYSKLDYDDRNMFEHGYIYYSKEEAEQHLKEQRLIFKIKKWAEIHNEGWEPDWSDWDINKFIICYDGRDEGLEIDVWGNTSHISVLPAFKTRGIAQACIDEFGEEIREVFC